MNTKQKNTIGWILSGLITAFLLMSATGKFLAEDMQMMMEKWGLAEWRVIIALGEIISALLFLYPKTNGIGTLLLSSYLGGAIIIHMSNNESFLIPAILVVIVWITGIIRNNSILINNKKQ